MRVVFFGSDRFSCLVLEQLLGSAHQVVGIVTQPDKAAGRGLGLCPTEVCTHASSSGVPVFKPGKLINNRELRRQLRELQPDAILVASYRKLIPPKLLELTPWPLNVHPSWLPRLRGASPVRSALLQGLHTTACCVMRMTPGLDNGDILLMKRLRIREDWDFMALRLRLGALGGALAGEALTQIEQGRASLKRQDHRRATYCHEFKRCDTLIDWTRGASELAGFIRAWSPDIGALCMLPDGTELHIWKAAPEPNSTERMQPGCISRVTRKALWIACGNGELRVEELQPASRPRMSAASFLAGRRLHPGEQLRLLHRGSPTPPAH